MILGNGCSELSWLMVEQLLWLERESLVRALGGPK